ncbi:transcription antitermination factor NusB [Herbiconiux sp. KACC 21604]|uniref:RsmB/NOP family class I SAM-dependent RNA methyltransferase n=1 Tax=unclassified Herbiconiux TaxID=2618217 RepID=UPI0014910E5F|nr:transcription antitermination factor NusB [Herbiconiux sp. SALV-R1]QJU53598.1 rRNA small subunit methyltransferase B [Herbiconiux sp. SALV-R1]WPO88578.1 transcription antitermination factor NusB [Herbiconiux sp. KACC 21604]
MSETTPARGDGGRRREPRRQGPQRRKPATPRPGPSEVQPARRIAREVIEAVRADDAYANLLLPGKIAAAGLAPADAALATELTYGTLRLRGYYDAVIERASGRPIDEIDGAVRDVLELGAHQILSMRVAQHAAVNESVELARQVASRSATGFVNGVLRAITRTAPEAWVAQLTEGAGSDDERLALATSHPAWVVRAFRRALVADGVAADAVAAELDDLLQADNTPARLSLAGLPGLYAGSDAESGLQPAALSPIGFVAPSGDPAGLAAVREGVLRVQDEGSQLAALALSRARDIDEGERWLDLCAGPGGKTAVLAAEARLAGATVVANEPVPARAGLVRRAVAAVPEAPTVWERDGTTIGDSEREAFDRILVDAPCTGLGALRRRPEARWRKTPADVAELVALQQALLDSAVKALKPGGLLAYVTCSPHVAETRGQVQGLLRRWPDELTQLDTQAVLRDVAGDTLTLGAPDPAAQLWPHRNTTDAMFIALFEKTP